MLEMLQGLRDLYHTIVRISYPKETIYDVIHVLDTNHSLWEFLGYSSCPKQDSSSKKKCLVILKGCLLINKNVW